MDDTGKPGTFSQHDPEHQVLVTVLTGKNAGLWKNKQTNMYKFGVFTYFPCKLSVHNKPSRALGQDFCLLSCCLLAIKKILKAQNLYLYSGTYLHKKYTYFIRL